MDLSDIAGNKSKIYFIGIGGVSMSALAKYLINCGFLVSGSDRCESETTKSLEKIGCKVFIGHEAKNVEDKDVIVYNSAIDAENVELKTAHNLKKCVLKRVELLQMIANVFNLTIGVSGSHGKTTSTAMLAHILFCADKKFASHIGGEDNLLGNFFQNGKDIFLSEVCEFDKNINEFSADVAVVLNIDNDHMNSYENIDELRHCFYAFLDRSHIPIINIDDEKIQKYCGKNKEIITFGVIEKSAKFSAEIIEKKTDSMLVRFFENREFMFDVCLNLIGEHNIYNALSAVATAKTLNIPNDKIIDGIKSFCGVKRRNELIGNLNGSKIIADYAHHPKEIECSLRSYKSMSEELIVVFQPHTYSRTKLLFDDFLRVLSVPDKLFIYKTYPAREDESQGYGADYLAEKLGCSNYYDDIDELFQAICHEAGKGKLILILGAGDLYDKIKMRMAIE